VADLLNPAGTSTASFTFTSNLGEILWSGDRLVRVWLGGGWLPVEVPNQPAPARAAQFTLKLEDPALGTAEILPASAGRVPHGPVDASNAHFTFTWAQRCLGLYDTVCTYELHRISMAPGTDTVVAVSSVLPPMALSPDGLSVAFATPAGIHVLKLP
jgi:hypothetical protein